MRVSPVALLLSLLLAPPIFAEVELTPMVGYRSGSTELFTGIVCVAQVGRPCPSVVENEDGASFGLVGNLRLDDRWWLEVWLNRYRGDLETEPFICPECNTVDLEVFGELEITTLQVGVQRRRTSGTWRPFVAVGAGLSRVRSEAGGAFFGVRIDDDRPSASLAGGVLVPMGDRLGLRFEVRGTWVDLPEDDFIFTEDLVQGEASGGLTFRW